MNQPILTAQLINKKLRDLWLSSLPLAHHDALEGELKLALKEINAAVTPPHQRYMCLEAIADPTAELIQAVKQNQSSSAFPIQDKYYQRIIQYQTLLQEMAKGYLITLESLAAHGHDNRDSTFFAVSIFRAMQLNLSHQYLAYINYRQPEISTWTSLNKLYSLAFSKRINLENVVASPLDLVKAENIDSLYKQSLLLSLANPLQLTNSMTMKLTSTLVYWAQFCNLYDVVDPTHHHGIFAVKLNDSTPPKPVNECDLTIGNCLFFDTSKLLNRFKQIIARPGIQLLPDNVKDLINSYPVDSMKRIYKSWGKLGKRTFARHNRHSEIVLTVGFSAIYNMLAQRLPPNAVTNTISTTRTTAASFQSKSVANIDGSGIYPDVLELCDHIETNSISHKQRSAQAKELNKENSPLPIVDKKLSAKILDESAGGYCLSLTEKLSQSISVGDLVCCQYPSDLNSLFTLCVVRWMKETEECFSFGIEVISPFAETVSLEKDDQGDSQTAQVPALLLPQIVSLQKQSSLITARDIKLKSPHRYNLVSPREKLTISLTTASESTNMYYQFQYSPVSTIAVNTSKI